MLNLIKRSLPFGAVVYRAQLPHEAGHGHVARCALDLCDQVVIVLGSSWRSRNSKNPFIFEERRAMILTMLTPEQRQRVHFVGVRDVYNDDRWVSMVRARVEGLAGPGMPITLVGFQKDATSYYLQRFPTWNFFDAGSPRAVDATALRNEFFGGKPVGQALDALRPFVHQGVLDYLAQWATTDEYQRRCAEHQANEGYRQKYPGPVYHTGDAIIEAADHFLMIERDGVRPDGSVVWPEGVLGRGCVAWPGGHGEAGETGLDTTLREFSEETTFDLTREELLAALVGTHVFDAPARSPRGRIVTTACHFKLEGYTVDTLPTVFGKDDAKKKPALWLDRRGFAERMHLMFDDHDVIGEHFMGEMQPQAELLAA